MSNANVKIQARNESFINPTIPTRDYVRRCNYSRRLTQLSCEGFYSKLWKPYICIGHPLELDKALEVSIIADKNTPREITKENKEKKCETTIDNNRTEQSSQCHKNSSEKFEQLNKNIKQEIRKSEMINFNVKTGQKFFEIVQKELEDKKVSASEASQFLKLKSKSEIRPPLVESDSDSEIESQISENLTQTSRPSTEQSKKRSNSRPFTPIYNTISNIPNKSSTLCNEIETSSRPLTVVADLDSDNIKEASIYRQLCCLHWLLEGMILDNVDNMPRISLSWTIKNEDNNLTSTRSRKEIKNAWEKYVLKPEGNLYGSKLRSHVPFQSNRVPTITSSQKPKEKSSEVKDNDGVQLPKSVKESDADPKFISNLSNKNKRPIQSALILRRQRINQVRSVCEDIEKSSNNYEDRKNLHLQLIRRHPAESKRISESTKLHPEYQFSDKLQQMMMRHYEQSNQIIDERMTELRENVKNMAEYKMTICLNKYKDIPKKGAFHQMIKSFRGRNTYQQFFSALDKSKNKSIYSDWFLTLEIYLKIYSDNKRIKQALEKIRQYALNTITKFSVNRFLTVLKYLADWEIKHPDISASIKFVTDHIIFMPEEDYQTWYNNNFK